MVHTFLKSPLKIHLLKKAKYWKPFKQFFFKYLNNIHNSGNHNFLFKSWAQWDIKGIIWGWCYCVITWSSGTFRSLSQWKCLINAGFFLPRRKRKQEHLKFPKQSCWKNLGVWSQNLANYHLVFIKRKILREATPQLSKLVKRPSHFVHTSNRANDASVSEWRNSEIHRNSAILRRPSRLQNQPSQQLDNSARPLDI